MRFELERNETERLIIESSEYKGRELVSLRIYFLSKENEWLLPRRKSPSGATSWTRSWTT